MSEEEKVGYLQNLNPILRTIVEVGEAILSYQPFVPVANDRVIGDLDEFLLRQNISEGFESLGAAYREISTKCMLLAAAVNLYTDYIIDEE